MAALRHFFYRCGVPHAVIGLTSNLLFPDEGLHVPCIQIGTRMSDVSISGSDVEAQAGAWVPGLARSLMKAGLVGAEHTCGIPGTLGGLVCMNGGSQRKGIGNNVLSVESVDQLGEIRTRSALECDFGYRQSVFQANAEVITSACLRFACGKRSAIRAEMRAILRERRGKFPRKEPNCGSVFKSNPSMYAEVGPPGAILERLGFKGTVVGGAQVSPLHANFINNVGGARAHEVLALINRMSDAVHRATGFRMEAEICYVTPQGSMLPADRVVT